MTKATRPARFPADAVSIQPCGLIRPHLVRAPFPRYEISPDRLRVVKTR